MRIFILLGSKNSVGNSYTDGEYKSCWKVSSRLSGGKVYSCLEKVQEFGLYANLLGNYPEVGDKS